MYQIIEIGSKKNLIEYHYTVIIQQETTINDKCVY